MTQLKNSPGKKSCAGLSVPASVKAGEPFPVEVSVGENLQTMGLAHWIGFIELSFGYEPAGRVGLQSKGYLKPRVSFTLVIPKEAAPSGKASLVAKQECNLHGLWEGTTTISVV
jgi:superoxide reductase